jgi:hypothetical protein
MYAGSLGFIHCSSHPLNCGEPVVPRLFMAGWPGRCDAAVKALLRVAIQSCFRK